MVLESTSNWPIPSSPTLVSKRSQEISQELTKKSNFFATLIRDVIYYPLYRFREEHNDKLEHEKEYYHRFWSDKGPRDLNLEKSEIIKQNYFIRDQPVLVYDNENTRITTVVRIIESKDASKNECLNVFIIPGSLSTLDNNLFPSYDFLLAHLKQQNNSPIRLVIFGHYETIFENDSEKTLYKPASFDALGEVLKRTVNCLSEEYGKFNVIYAHSAGCKALASLLKKSGPDILPAIIHFDRGASSMYEASNNYFLGGGLYLIAKYSGLGLDIDREIMNYFDRCTKLNSNLEKSTCIITGVEKDYVYPGKSNLARSDFFNKLPKGLNFAIWMFNPPEQVNHSRAHHNWRLTHLNKSYLFSTQGNVEMRSDENLAESILRLSRLKKACPTE